MISLLGITGLLNQAFVEQDLSDFSVGVPHLWSMSRIPWGGRFLISERRECFGKVLTHSKTLSREL